METAVYRQMFSEKTALLLQQVLIPAENSRVLFACVCESERKGKAGEFCAESVDYFREHFFDKNFEENLGGFFEKKEKKGQICAYSAVFFKDSEGTFFGRGESGICILSRFLQKVRVRNFAAKTADGIRVSLEKNTGILLVTKSLRKTMAEGNFGGEFFENEGERSAMERMLKRLGDSAEKGGERENAAVAVRI